MSVVGTYIVALWLETAQTIRVGRLGPIQFPAGWYLYAGSALGPGGLTARLARHRRRLGRGKKPHWHVDYLREQAAWHGAWVRASDQPLECRWAAALRDLPGAEIVAHGFGASDCNCPAHLVRVPVLPDDAWFGLNLGAERNIMQDEQLDDLLCTLGSGNEEAREGAAQALGQLGPVAIEPLTAMLAESDKDARWWAARALAEVGEAGGIYAQGAIQPLIGALGDADPDVRACAALALGRIGDGSAAPAVAGRLADESAFVAGIAADALAMIGEPAIGPLAEALAYSNPHTRLLAVRALSRIRSQSVLGPLFGALEDSSYLVRYYAEEALEAMGVGMLYLSP